MQEYARVTRPVAAAGTYYDRLARWYDILASSEKKFIRQGINLLKPAPGEWILEIGSGTGYAQGQISPLIREGFSVALDLSAGMIAVARKRLSGAGDADRTGFVLNDSLPLPFQNQSFDAVFASFTLELFDSPRIPSLLAECRRVLKPGGRLVVVSLSKDRPLGLMGRLYEAFHNRFPTLADCRPIPARHLVEAAGFKIQQAQERKMWGLPVIIVRAGLQPVLGM